MNKKKWLTLSAISIGLLLIPRRSSQKSTLSSNSLPKKEDSSIKTDKEEVSIKSQNHSQRDND